MLKKEVRQEVASTMESRQIEMASERKEAAQWHFILQSRQHGKIGI